MDNDVRIYGDALLTREQKLIQVQADILEMVTTKVPLDTIFDSLTGLIETLDDSLFCSILLVSDDRKHLRLGSARKFPEAFNRAVDGFEIADGNGSCGTAAFRNEPVIVEDIANSPYWSKYAEFTLQHGFRSCWSNPIRDISGNCVGIFAIYTGQPSSPEPYHLQMIKMASYLAEIAIDRANIANSDNKLSSVPSELLEKVADFDTLFNVIPIGIAIADDPECLRIRANPALAAMVGVTPEVNVSKSAPVDERPNFKVMSGDDEIAAEELPMQLAAAKNMIVKDMEFDIVRSDGTRVSVLQSAVPRYGLDGRVRGSVGILVDITALKKAREEYAKAVQAQETVLKDVLFSVTQGKLRLCFTPSELPVKLNQICPRNVLDPLAIDLSSLREMVRTAATDFGLTPDRQYDLISGVSEAAMNACVHGGGGIVDICGQEGDMLQVWISDRGKGIDMEHLPKATLERGFTTAGTFGHGLKITLESVDRIWLLTNHEGTTIVLEEEIAPKEQLW